MSINRVVLTGRLSKDVELKYTQSGKSVASFTLAVNDNFNKEKTHWINCTVWGKPAESCAQYIGKGSLVAVDGRINTRDYENNEGRKVYITEVVADSVQFLDSKKSGDKPVDKPLDQWDDIGKEIKLEDMNLPDEDIIPF
jgi:single-strand DNA-binding protein